MPHIPGHQGLAEGIKPKGSLYDTYTAAGINIPVGYSDSSDQEIEQMFGHKYEQIMLEGKKTLTKPSSSTPIQDFPSPTSIPTGTPPPPPLKFGGNVKGTGGWAGKSVPGMISGRHK